MNECKKCKRLIEKALYGELKIEETNFFNGHLSSCTDCAKEFEELKNSLNLFKTRTRPEPDEIFMNTFWETLEPKLKKKQSFLFVWWTGFVNSFRFRITWKYQLTGAIALLVIGIFIGKYLSSRHETTTQYTFPGKEHVGIQQTVNVGASNYIERSKVLLLGMMNFDPATDDVETISLSHQRKISRELISQASEIKADLKNPSQQQLKKLISDIELILMQIANLETQYDLSGIELIKDGVKSRGIFLKINIQEMKDNSKEFNPKKGRTKSESEKI